IECIPDYGILRLPEHKASPIAHLRFTDVQDRPAEFLDLTSLRRDELQQLVPPFEAAFHAHMAAWRLDGETPDRPPVERVQELPLAGARRSALLPAHVSKDVQPPSGPGTLIRHGAEQSPSVDARSPPSAAGSP